MLDWKFQNYLLACSYAQKIQCHISRFLQTNTAWSTLVNLLICKLRSLILLSNKINFIMEHVLLVVCPESCVKVFCLLLHFSSDILSMCSFYVFVFTSVLSYQNIPILRPSISFIPNRVLFYSRPSTSILAKIRGQFTKRSCLHRVYSCIFLHILLSLRS